MSKAETTNGNQSINDKKEREVTVMTTNNIIDFNLGTMKEETKYKRLGEALGNIQKYGFIVGVIAAHLNGVTIPSYTMKDGTHVETVKRDGIGVSEIVNNKHVEGYSRSTIDRMVGAVRRLTSDEGAFEKFANGTYQFTYDKIYSYYDNKEAMAAAGIDSIDKAMDTSVRELKKIVKGENGGGGNGGTTEDTEVQFTYEGKKYSVKKSAMDSFLKSCTPVRRGKNK